LRRLTQLSVFLLFLPFVLIAQTKENNDSLMVQFKPEAGFYTGQQEVYLFAPGATAIYYTLDGSMPTQQSQPYIRSVFIDETTVIRAIAYWEDEKGIPGGQTYFIDEPPSRLPTISIGIHPSILFHPSKGIFVQGHNAVDSLWHKPGANFWTRREYRVHIDMFEDDGQSVYSNLSGLRLFGGMSRLFPQKSMAIIAREQYGAKHFKHNFFTKDDPKKYKFLVLRNSGSDFGKSHFRDGLMTSLVEDWDLETQAFRPAQVYINGTYWGIYNIREKVNRFFIEDHAPQGIDKDSIDFLEHYAQRKRGHRYHYREMLDFLDRYDLDVPGNYKHLQTYMEVDNFMEYQIAQIYFDNRDAGGNIKYWRPQTTDGRWRWILYDTDWGFGLHSEEAYRNNSLAFHTKPNGPHWPNPPWSTFLLRKLLKNPSFQQDFITRFSDHLNTSFKEEKAKHQVDSFYLAIKYDMPRHLKRWRLSAKTWEKHIDRMRVFAEKRPPYIRDHLREKFKLGGDRSIQIEAGQGGTVLLNDYVEVEHTYKGIYFEDFPVKLRALPNYGYRFVGWEGTVDNTERNIAVDLKQDRSYRFEARFETFTHPMMDQVMINEVCAKSKKAGDWVEILNKSETTVHLGGWVLTDVRNEFIFPDIELLPNDYLIICKDAERFRATFPDAYNVIGGLGFGINKRKETLGLYDRLGATVDSISYELPPLDTSFTLSLSLPELDNADRENWDIQKGLGTPNAPNPYFVESHIRNEQSEWMQIGLAAGVFILSLFLLRLRKKGVL